MVGIGRRIIFILTGVLAMQLSATLCAQNPYNNLIERRAFFYEQQQQIQQSLSAARQLLATAETGSEQYGARIIELEQQLFATRDSLNSISAEIGRLEGSGIIVMPPSAPTAPLPREEYGMLFGSDPAEAEVAEMLVGIRRDYGLLAALSASYSVAEKGPVADSLYGAMTSLTAKNNDKVSSFSALWTELFDNSLYACNYILDRRNDSGLLSGIERTMREMLSEREALRGKYMYDAVAAYPTEKKLLLSCEIAIAEHAGLHTEADSLRALLSGLDERDYRLPVIDLGERLFIDYSDFSVGGGPAYNSPSAIPETEIHARGTVYRILVGAFRAIQPVGVFRNVSPLSREHKNGMYHYYVGGYRTQDEAATAAARLRAAGFRNPRPVVWVDGVYNENPVSSGGAITGTTQTSYRIEIRGAEGSLPTPLSELIKEHAAGKEISRLADNETGKHIFVVGFFNDRAAAEQLASGITTTSQGALDVAVTEAK